MPRRRADRSEQTLRRESAAHARKGGRQIRRRNGRYTDAEPPFFRGTSDIRKPPEHSRDGSERLRRPAKQRRFRTDRRSARWTSPHRKRGRKAHAICLRTPPPSGKRIGRQHRCCCLPARPCRSAARRAASPPAALLPECRFARYKCGNESSERRGAIRAVRTTPPPPREPPGRSSASAPGISAVLRESPLAQAAESRIIPFAQSVCPHMQAAGLFILRFNKNVSSFFIRHSLLRMTLRA